jgi:PqqD family protein of HPr-rel-A system
MVLLSAGRELVWQEWDDVYLVYQPSSGETHVFNETTALILRSLDQGPLAAALVKDWSEKSLGIDAGELGDEDFAFAVGRLQELGLIDCLDEAIAAQ